jgi:replicative DNA helicase
MLRFEKEIGMTDDYKLPPNSYEDERAVLGSVLIDARSDNVQRVFSFLTSEMFYNRQHGVIYQTMRNMNNGNQTIDLLTVHASLEASGKIDDIGGFAYLAELSRDTPSSANVMAYANRVKDTSTERMAIEQANRILEVLYTRSGMTTAQKLEAFQTMAMKVDERSRSGNHRGLVSFRDAFNDWTYKVGERLEGNTASLGITSGIEALDEMLEPKRIVRGSLFVVGARPKMGKAMPMESKILLSDGTWTTHGEIQVGQKIASVDGRSSVVTGIFPQGVRRMFEITFEDGRTAKAADSHLWEISSSKFKGSRTVDTEKLQQMLEKTRYQGRLCVPSVSGDFGKSQEQIDGWVLGALLGDGSLMSGVKFTNSERYVLSRMEESVHPLRMVKTGENDYLISNQKGKKNPLIEKIRDLGLFGKSACQKHIPDFVFSSDKETRIGVLTGLLETDGWVEKFGSIRFSSSSKKLAEGVVRLVHSLGGTAKETMRTDISYTYKGETRTGMDAQMVSLKLPDVIISRIESPRIRENLGINRLGNRGVGVRSVVEIPAEECLCIMVSHPRHLYVTDDYLVTHNTTVYQKMAIHCALVENLPTVAFSLEMPKDQMVERIVSQHSRVNSNVFYQNGYEENKFAMALAKGSELADNDNLFIDDTPGLSLAHIVSESRRIKRERGQIGMILVDYLTLMTAEKADTEAQAYGIITKGLKVLAKELNCVVVLLTQLNRGSEARANKRPVPSDSRSTGQIEQDCDYWMGIYREAEDNDAVTDNETELLLRLNRHGQTGTVYADQRNGILYDVDQMQAQRRIADRESTKNQRKGGF